jgi:hypothetical protein
LQELALALGVMPGSQAGSLGSAAVAAGGGQYQDQADHERTHAAIFVTRARAVKIHSRQPLLRFTFA